MELGSRDLKWRDNLEDAVSRVPKQQIAGPWVSGLMEELFIPFQSKYDLDLNLARQVL